MKCPECEALGLKSTLIIDSIFSTCMGSSQFFYDEDGKYHAHDRNYKTRRQHCSLGHVTVVEIENKCWCGWSNK